jgi:hypothetical protein
VAIVAACLETLALICWASPAISSSPIVFMRAGKPIAANHGFADAGTFFTWCVERGKIEMRPCYTRSAPAPIGETLRCLESSRKRSGPSIRHNLSGFDGPSIGR